LIVCRDLPFGPTAIFCTYELNLKAYAIGDFHCAVPGLGVEQAFGSPAAMNMNEEGS
jgi:hypothetical protein